MMVRMIDHLVYAANDLPSASATVTQLLSEHYDAAMKAGATGTDALKSTFITACLSPTSVAMGL